MEASAVEAYANICYPTQIGGAISACLVGAALVSAIGAVASDGTAAGHTFTEALKVCIATEGVQLADQVSAQVGIDTTCGPWH